MNRHQLLECYMVMGGVPFYWTHLQRGMSLSQNVDALFFAKNAPLCDEFDYVFSSLFRHPSGYLAIVEALSTRKSGIARDEIIRMTGLPDSGDLTKKLSELQSCGFIRQYLPFGKKRKGAIYQLIDNFTLFAFRFLRGQVTDNHFWTNQTNHPSRNAWCGIAFECVCLEHVPQIKRALGISGVFTEVSSWACRADDELGTYGSQIDLLLVRKDQVINLCEMKYSSDEYVVTARTEESIRHKVHDLQLASRTRSAIHPTLITPYGMKVNSHSGAIQSVVTGDELFS